MSCGLTQVTTLLQTSASTQTMTTSSLSTVETTMILGTILSTSCSIEVGVTTTCTTQTITSSAVVPVSTTVISATVTSVVPVTNTIVQTLHNASCTPGATQSSSTSSSTSPGPIIGGVIGGIIGLVMVFLVWYLLKRRNRKMDLPGGQGAVPRDKHPPDQTYAPYGLDSRERALPHMPPRFPAGLSLPTDIYSNAQSEHSVDPPAQQQQQAKAGTAIRIVEAAPAETEPLINPTVASITGGDPRDAHHEVDRGGEQRRSTPYSPGVKSGSSLEVTSSLNLSRSMSDIRRSF